MIRRVPDDMVMREPGIYIDVDHRRFAVKPVITPSRHEAIPFSWATELPPLGDFVQRFPAFWKADTWRECWISCDQTAVEHGVYWCMFDPMQILRVGEFNGR